MKKILLVICLIALTVYGCKKDSNLPTPSQPTNQPTNQACTITDSTYLGTWYKTNLTSNSYQNIGPDGTNPYTYSHFDDCTTPSISNQPQLLQFRNDTMVFMATSGYEWVYSCGGDTLRTGVGLTTHSGFYLKCN